MHSSEVEFSPQTSAEEVVVMQLPTIQKFKGGGGGGGIYKYLPSMRKELIDNREDEFDKTERPRF